MANRTRRTARLKRLRAILALRGETFSHVARRLGVSPSHLRFVVLQKRTPSQRLRSELQAELRGDEWSFVCGETDVLSVESTR